MKTSWNIHILHLILLNYLTRTTWLLFWAYYGENDQTIQTHLTERFDAYGDTCTTDPRTTMQNNVITTLLKQYTKPLLWHLNEIENESYRRHWVCIKQKTYLIHVVQVKSNFCFEQIVYGNQNIKSATCIRFFTYTYLN